MNKYFKELMDRLNKSSNIPVAFKPNELVKRINMLFLNKPNKRGLPNGIIKCQSGYLSKYAGKELGTYQTLEDAYAVYAKAKENKIKEVADEYKNIIPKETYEALYRYKVKIENDKNYKAS